MDGVTQVPPVTMRAMSMPSRDIEAVVAVMAGAMAGDTTNRGWRTDDGLV
jgi:hypothetical protein